MKYLISFDTDIVRQEQAPEWSIDEVLILGSNLSLDLSNLPQDKEPTVLFIPTVFDYNNSLSYNGADLALRILMQYLRKDITDIDIVLIGNETETNFLLHYNYPNILKMPGMHYIQFNKKIVASYKLPQREQLKANEYKPYLDNLGLQIPSSFKSTHSLTNEWCLYKWNSFMGFNENASSLEGLLYLDYIITIEKLVRIKSKIVTDRLKERISKFSASRILVIDDRKEWHIFFRDMFLKSDKVNIHCIGEDFNKLEFTDIERGIVEEVNKFKPHVIILDFRLMEDKDAEVKDDMQQISGYRVLTKILKGNYKEPLGSFGRQVIIFTATSRIENILLLREGNADGFILKEKPENYNGKENTKNVISRMVSSLEEAISRADFLIPLNEKLDDLLKISKNNATVITDELASTILHTSQSVRQFSQNNDLDEDLLKLIYLNIFNVFEDINRDSNYIDFKNDFTLVIKGNNTLTISQKSKCAMSSKSDDDWNYKPIFTPSSRHEKYCKDKSLNFAMCALILFRLGKSEVDETKWNVIRLIRNAIAHGDITKLEKIGMSLDANTLKKYSLEMLDLIISIMSPSSINEKMPKLS